MAFPTKDPKLIEERERIRAEWNAQFGKMQSNTATDEEIDAYYGAQQQLSNDYLEFLVYLAEHYGNLVPRAEIGVLKLAGEMHLARLEEIPRKIAEAKERHAAHEKARQALARGAERVRGRSSRRSVTRSDAISRRRVGRRIFLLRCARSW